MPCILNKDDMLILYVLCIQTTRVTMSLIPTYYNIHRQHFEDVHAPITVMEASVFPQALTMQFEPL